MIMIPIQDKSKLEALANGVNPEMGEILSGKSTFNKRAIHLSAATTDCDPSMDVQKIDL